MEKTDVQAVTEAYYSTMKQVIDEQAREAEGDKEEKTQLSQTSEGGKEDKVRAFEQFFARPLLGPAMPSSPLRTQESTQEATPTPTPRAKPVTFPGLNELGGRYDFPDDVFRDPAGGTLSNFAPSENATPANEGPHAEEDLRSPVAGNERGEEGAHTRARKRTRVEEHEVEQAGPKRIVAPAPLGRKGKQAARQEPPRETTRTETVYSPRRLFTEQQTKSLMEIAIENYAKEGGEKMADAARLKRVVTMANKKEMKDAMDFGMAVARAQPPSPNRDPAHLPPESRRTPAANAITNAAAREPWAEYEMNFKRARPGAKQTEKRSEGTGEKRGPPPPPAGAVTTAPWEAYAPPRQDQYPMDVDAVAGSTEGLYEDYGMAVSWTERPDAEVAPSAAENSQQRLSQASTDSQAYYGEPAPAQGSVCRGHGGGWVRKVAYNECPGLYPRGPDDIMRGVRPDVVEWYDKLPPRTKLVVQPFNQTRLDNHMQGQIATKLKAAAYEILGPNDMEICPPMSRDELREDGEHPVAWIFYNLTDEQWETFVAYPVYSLEELAFSTHPEPFVPSRYLITFMGLEDNTDENIVEAVREGFLMLSGITNLVDAIRGNRPRAQYEKTAREMAKRFDVVVNRDMAASQTRTAKVWATVYCDPPCAGRKWVEWRSTMKDMRIPRINQINARVAPPMRCRTCHSAEHTVTLCLFPKIPGWQTPDEIHIEFPPTHAPRYAGQSYQAKFKPTAAVRGMGRGGNPVAGPSAQPPRGTATGRPVWRGGRGGLQFGRGAGPVTRPPQYGRGGRTGSTTNVPSASYLPGQWL
ncbi:hypothetical protein C8Q79DRAFT_923591 [Trametes meyenii]|nr:hypothetical protein C8Q79DRAFT_923591 [Trametes meyenii]